MTDIIDLDVFVPEPRTIKYEDTEITITSPKTIDLIQLGSLTDKLSDVTGMTDAEVEAIVSKITERIYKIIPELNGKPLSKAQLQVIVNIMADMAMPDSARALSAKGITRDTAKKVR